MKLLIVILFFNCILLYKYVAFKFLKKNRIHFEVDKTVITCEILDRFTTKINL